MSDVQEQHHSDHDLNDHDQKQDHEHNHGHSHGHNHSHGNDDPFCNPSKLFILKYSFRNYIRRRSYYKEIMKQLNLKGSENVIDFGSGVGTLAKKLAPKLQKNGKLVCSDVSEKLLNHTKDQLKKYSNIDYLLGNLSDQNLTDKSFDYVISTWVLHHLNKNDLELTIKKFSTILKDNGKIFIIEFPEEYEHNHHFHNKIKLNDILALFNEHQFKNRVLLFKDAGILYEFHR